MTISLNLMNLLSSVATLADRLTTVLRGGVARSSGRQDGAQSSQSPPSLARGRGVGRLWAYRQRIVTIRAGDLTPHLRRDIGLDS